MQSLWASLAKFVFNRSLRLSPVEESESRVQHRLRIWREMGVDLAVQINPVVTELPGSPVSDNPTADHFPMGKTPCKMGDVTIDLDMIEAQGESNIQQANEIIRLLATEHTDEFNMLWIWFVQAGHKFLKEGRPDLALRAYLNEIRIREVSEHSAALDPIMSLNLGMALQELGNYLNAGNSYAMAAHEFLAKGEQIEAADALERSGLAWEKVIKVDPHHDRPALGIAHENFAHYNSTLCFRRAKYLYSSCGDFDGASRCTVLERDCDRRWSKSRVRRLILGIMRGLWLYGESPIRILMSVLTVWLSAALIYACCGFAESGHATWDGREGFKHFAEALYLSIITLTTIGYGDFVPAAGISRAIAGAEGMAGILLGAMLIITMQRRYAGR
jgi:hypothetical protein